MCIQEVTKNNLGSLCRFSGGGDLTVHVTSGPVVIGGTSIGDDDDSITPLKNGDCPTTSNVEKKHPVNTKSYEDTEMQLFANMHLSASQFIVEGLVEQSLSTIDMKRMVAYGLILKPASNQVILYKLVAEFNKPTYNIIQIEYKMTGLFWHVHFNRALRYTFDKLTIARDTQ